MLVQQTVRSDNGWSILWSSSEALSNRINRTRVGVQWKRDLVSWVDYGLQLLDHVKLGKRGLPIDHLV